MAPCGRRTSSTGAKNQSRIRLPPIAAAAPLAVPWSIAIRGRRSLGREAARLEVTASLRPLAEREQRLRLGRILPAHQRGGISSPAGTEPAKANLCFHNLSARNAHVDCEPPHRSFAYTGATEARLASGGNLSVRMMQREMTR